MVLGEDGEEGGEAYGEQMGIDAADRELLVITNKLKAVHDGVREGLTRILTAGLLLFLCRPLLPAVGWFWLFALSSVCVD